MSIKSYVSEHRVPETDIMHRGTLEHSVRNRMSPSNFSPQSSRNPMKEKIERVRDRGDTIKKKKTPRTSEPVWARLICTHRDWGSVHRDCTGLHQVLWAYSMPPIQCFMGFLSLRTNVSLLLDPSLGLLVIQGKSLTQISKPLFLLKLEMIMSIIHLVLCYRITDSTAKGLANESNYLTLTIICQAQKTMHGIRKAAGD